MSIHRLKSIMWWIFGLFAIVVMGCLVLHEFNKFREFGSIQSNLRLIEGAKEQWAMENKKMFEDTVSMADLTQYFKHNQIPASVGGEAYRVTTVGALATAILSHPVKGRLGPLTVTGF